MVRSAVGVPAVIKAVRKHRRMSSQAERWNFFCQETIHDEIRALSYLYSDEYLGLGMSAGRGVASISPSISRALSNRSQSMVLAASAGIGGATENAALNLRLGVLTKTALASEADDRRPRVDSLSCGIFAGVFCGGRRVDVGVFAVVQFVVYALCRESLGTLVKSSSSVGAVMNRPAVD